MKEKKKELKQPLASDSVSNLDGDDTSELEYLDVISSELGEKDSTQNFNEEEFYKEKTSFLSQLFFCWTSPLFHLSKLKNINIQSLKKTKKSPFNSSINCKDLFTPYYSLIEYYNSPTSKTYHHLLFSILRVNILDEIIVLSLSLTMSLLGIYRVNVFRKFMAIFETTNNKDFYPKSLYSISALLLFIRLSQILISHFNDFLCEKLCSKTRAQLYSFIYYKIMNTSLFIKSYFNRGKIINFLHSDIETINFLFYYAPMTLVVPFQIGGHMIILFKLFGASFIWSFLTFFILITIAWVIEYFYIKTKKKNY